MAYQASFFPEINTLGDVLADEGYKQYFFIGSIGQFGGREEYFKEHGDYEVDDYNWAMEKGLIPEGYYEWWGYEDEKLFSFAKDRLTEIAAEGEPFNFTMLTADTHLRMDIRVSSAMKKTTVTTSTEWFCTAPASRSPSSFPGFSSRISTRTQRS